MLGDVELDDIVELHIRNLEKWAETHDVNKLVPYIEGRAIRGNYPEELHVDRGRIIYHLEITPENRKTWIDLLGNQMLYANSHAQRWTRRWIGVR